MVYKSAVGNRFFVQNQLPEVQKDLLRRYGIENWLFNVPTDSALDAFIKDHEEEIRLNNSLYHLMLRTTCLFSQL